MRAGLALFAALVAGACSDSTAPVPVARVSLSADTIVILGEADGHAQVVAYDAAGAPIASPEIHWEIRNAFPWTPVPAEPRTVVAFDSTSGAVHAVKEGRVWLVALGGPSRDSVLVSVEKRVTAPLDLRIDTLETAPGASFQVVSVAPGSSSYYIDPAWVGHWSSSNPAVAAWVPVTGSTTYGPGPSITMLAPGTTTLTLSYGGQTASRTIRVRAPGPLTVMDETGTCGLDAAGDLWCKGDDRAGNLATFTATLCSRACFEQGSAAWVHGARGLHFRAITTGVRFEQHRCAIAVADSRAYCWGYNHDFGVTTRNRLAGPSATTNCPESGIITAYSSHSCSYVPLAVDRMLDRQLIFRTIKAVAEVTCGTTGAPGAPEEIWCWGDTEIPTLRTSFPAGWPAA